ncbi:MAG TPA: nitrile hydratase subunit beta [Gammaproteobacteria bacterium]|nr:nitrile hydratase subunit beta [Gammaproteobacteria bacterium]
MDGIHDLGGMQGFGPIVVEADEPTFHHPWQAKAFALMVATQAVMRTHNTDEYRHSIERMNPLHYLQADYYERVLTGTTTLLVEKGVLSVDELEQAAGGSFALAGPIAADPMVALTPQPEHRFAAGDRVRVLPIHPAGHVRAPQFCRGHEGVILHRAPQFRFPDTSAHAGPHRKEHTYHVEFAAADLWPEEGAANDTVVVDLWDSYLEGAGV